MSRVQVLGLLRFSYPSIYNGRGQGDEFAAYQQSLYEPARLQRRVLWFEHVVLPSLRNQIDKDFKCVLLVGDQLPEPYRTQLLNLVDTVPQITLAMEPEGQRHRKTVVDLMAKHSDPDADIVAEFQLDDDDGVGSKFVKQTRFYYDLVAPMMRADRRVTLDFCSGVMLRLDAQGVDIKPVQARLWTPALVTYRPPDARTVLRTISHLDLWQHMPTLSLVEPVMFVRGAHEDNVSQLSKRWDRFRADIYNPDEMLALLQNDFGIDLEAMENARASLG